jgi:hypothetical protein
VLGGLLTTSGGLVMLFGSSGLVLVTHDSSPVGVTDSSPRRAPWFTANRTCRRDTQPFIKSHEAALWMRSVRSLAGALGGDQRDSLGRQVLDGDASAPQ